MSILDTLLGKKKTTATEGVKTSILPVLPEEIY